MKQVENIDRQGWSIEIIRKVFKLDGKYNKWETHPTARFKIRMADKQSLEAKGAYKKMTSFCDHATLAPISERIIDELLCSKFKRNEHKQS